MLSDVVLKAIRNRNEEIREAINKPIRRGIVGDLGAAQEIFNEELGATVFDIDRMLEEIQTLHEYQKDSAERFATVVRQRDIAEKKYKKMLALLDRKIEEEK